MKRTIGEIAEIVMGQSPKSEFYNNNGEGMPFLQGNRTFGDLYPTFDTYTTNPTKMAKAGDIIMSVRAPVGDLNITPVDMCLGRGVCALRMKNGNQSYLFYLLKHNVKTLINRESGTVFGSVNYKDIASLIVDYEENEEEQQRIGQFLWDIDQKIETNKAINNNLEQQTLSIFYNLFASSDDSMETELGYIPRTFSVTKVGQLPMIVTDYVANGSFASLKENVNLYQEPNYAYFIRNTDLKADSFGVYVDKHSYEFLSKSALFGGEIIISNVGDVGSVHLCPVLDRPMTLGNNIIMLRPSEELRYYLYIWFKYAQGQSLIQGIKGGSAQPKFNKTDFKSLPIAIPNDTILCSFSSVVSPMFALINSNKMENNRLIKIRDSILPCLMTGEIDVSDVKF